MIRIFSRGIKKIPHLEAFLAEEGEKYRDGEDVVVGWGHKQTAAEARAYAGKKKIPYIALEDGFLRSLRLGVEGAAPLSLTVDPIGVYYDSSAPSAVENWLNGWEGWFTPELRDRSARAMALLRCCDLSKYNAAPSCTDDAWRALLQKIGAAAESRKILLVDQTRGDASILLGGASEESFARMLRDALEEEGAEIFIKTHPDVACGMKEGCFPEIPSRVHLITEGFAPLGFLRRFDEVRVATSQMGFEALIAGVPVRTYGTPFYSGWGLTEDYGPLCARRSARPPLEALFAAAYILLSRYVNPIFGTRMTLEEAVDFLADQRRANERNRGTHLAIGFRRWKKPHVRNFLSGTASRLDFIWDVEKGFRRAENEAALRREEGFEVVRWAGKVTDSEAEAAAEKGIQLTRMEDGFLRSCGLGVDFTNPYSLVLDRSGIYYDPMRESDLVKILKTIRLRPDHDRLTERADNLRRFIVEHELTKYNLREKVAPPEWVNQLKSRAQGRKIILVVGQVDGDQSVKRGGGIIQSCRALLETVRKNHPGAYVVYKPHPDVASGNREGDIPQDMMRRLVDCTAENISLSFLWDKVDELHTLTSLSSFEALLRGKRVFTYGKPFYAGWGLTTDMALPPRINSPLSLNELVAGTLLVYPLYWDWQTRQFARAEDVACRLALRQQLPPPFWVELCRLMKNYLIQLNLWPKT